MLRTRFTVVATIFLWTTTAPSAGQPPVEVPRSSPQAVGPSNSKENSDCLALLIGCSQYDNNPAISLKGPANDVELLKSRLVSQFHFPPQQIVILSEAAAAAGGNHLRPTRENIEREFHRLAGVAKTRDRVVVSMAGHGSRQPARSSADPKYPKPDGKDQIFLPADVGLWNGAQRGVDRAIVDYELRNWTKAITATGASLWLIMDCCFSGSTLREGSEASVRGVTPTELQIPQTVIANSNRSGISLPMVDNQSTNFVAMYASEPNDRALELPFPVATGRRKMHGMLTYSVCEALNQVAGRQVSYDQLFNAVRLAYHRQQVATNPLLEGLGRKRLVLGLEEVPTSSLILTEHSTLGWRLDAGLLQKVTPNSLFAVYPATTQAASKRIGYVKVTQADLLNAWVVPCGHTGQPAISDRDLELGCRCEPVFLDLGSIRIPIAIDKCPVKPDTQVSLRTLETIEQDLAKLANRDHALFELATADRPARWVVQQRANKLMLLPKRVADLDGNLSADVVSVTLSPTRPMDDLVQHLNRLARTEGLLDTVRGTNAFPQGAVRPIDELAENNGIIDVEVVTFIHPTGNKLDDGRPAPVVDGQLRFKAGDALHWRIVNHSRFTVEVTLLYVDSQFHVFALFPRPGGNEHQIPTGGKLDVGQGHVSETTVGTERLVVIVVRSTGQSQDYTVLAEADLALRQRGEIESPVERLMRAAVFGGDQRGNNFELAREYVVGEVVWRVAMD